MPEGAANHYHPRIMIALLKRPIPDRMETRHGARVLVVAVRRNARARHYRLAVGAAGQAVLTVPPGGRHGEAQRFLDAHAGWLAARLARAAAAVRFEPGALVPVRGEPHRLFATGRPRGRVEARMAGGEPTLFVPGAAEHFPRRLTDWLRAECQTDLDARVAFHAGRLGVRPAAVRLRSQTGRWGSCSSSGRLNFNWRLIHAPGFVLDYVAAHEVAHLVEMNHSRAFWDTVERTLPDMAHGRDWLKANGQALMAIGR